MGMVRDDGKTMTAQPHLDLNPEPLTTAVKDRRTPGTDHRLISRIRLS